MLATAIEQHRGKNLRVAHVGAGSTVILLHGYPDTLQIWSNLAVALARNFQVIAFDWPGLGQSEPWPGGATPFDMARRLLALMDDWSVKQAILVGHDMGGQPALALAAEHPERVSGLVVMNSLLIWDEQTSWEIALLRKFGWNRVLLERMPRAVFFRALRTFLPRADPLPAAIHDDFWSCFRRREVRRFIVRMCAGYQGTLPKMKTLYAGVRVPALFLWAGAGRHFPHAHGRECAALVRDARFEEIRGAEHWMAWYLAGEIAERISRLAAAK
jgi:pimeloyl-ACP methyl ester carboxylesterase